MRRLLPLVPFAILFAAYVYLSYPTRMLIAGVGAALFYALLLSWQPRRRHYRDPS